MKTLYNIAPAVLGTAAVTLILLAFILIVTTL